MPKKLTLSDFISRAINLYGDRYDYSKTKFINTQSKVCIICKEHGEFFITPNNFLNGHKCPACSGRKRITKEVFINRSNVIHKGRYDYSKVDWKGANSKVCIICPIHGEFWQIAKYHLIGNGCQKCFATPKSNTEEFIQKAKAIYGDRYDYSKVEYKGNKEKVCIICSEHGEWWMSPNNHLRGHRCPSCYGTPKHTNEEFVAMARKVHGDKYDYSKVQYDGNKKKVCIICPKHGEFWQCAQTHTRGSGCPKCTHRVRITLDDFIRRSIAVHTIKYDYSSIIPKPKIRKNKKVKPVKIKEPKKTWLITPETFIERAALKHDNKYDYSKTQYVGRQEKICIICPIHGEFWQNPHFHLQGGNCPKCVGGVRLTTEQFVEKAKLVHGNKYDYSKVEYKNTSTKVCIICREHGEFWQTPNNHLFGAGCPTCPQSNLEGEIRQFLIKNNIKFEQEKTFSWLVFSRKMFLDFFLPEYGVGIECQGGQHFSPIDLFGGEIFYKMTLERDKAKKELCEKHGIKVLYYSNAHIDYPYPVFESVRQLLKAIKQHGVVESHQWRESPYLPFEEFETKSN